MGKLTNVSYEHTGGGVMCYSALYNDKYWVFGGDEYMEAFSVNPLECDDFDDHLIENATDFPTWAEVIDSIPNDLCDYYWDNGKESMRTAYISYHKTITHHVNYDRPEDDPSISVYVHKFAEYLAEHEDVYAYSNCHSYYGDHLPDIVPTEFIHDDYFSDILPTSSAELIDIGIDSADTLDGAFCWYDAKKKQFFSSDHPFQEGYIDAYALADFLLSPKGFAECFELVVDADDCEKIFGCDFTEMKQAFGTEKGE